jgi:hypothetical protein
VIDISTLNRTRGRTPFRRLAATAVAAIAVAAIAVPAAALAADPTADQYDSTLQTLSGGSSGTGTPGGAPSNTATSAAAPAAGAPSATASDAGGSLPFTGLDIGLLAVVAGGLTLAGFLLRRQAREASDRP